MARVLVAKNILLPKETATVTPVNAICFEGSSADYNWDNEALRTGGLTNTVWVD